MDAKQIMRLCDRASLQDPAKRQRLMQLLCAGALGLAAPPLQAAWFGSSPKKLDDDRSIYKLKGEVLVNGERADKNTRIYAGDTVRTGERIASVEPQQLGCPVHSSVDGRVQAIHSTSIEIAI